jgi:tetratricopeptide (TPR) repeat protein
MSINFKKEEVFEKLAQAAGYKGVLTGENKPVHIWEITGDIPSIVKENPSQLIRLSKSDSFFEILQLERLGAKWILVTEIPSGTPIEECLKAMSSQKPFPFNEFGEVLACMCEALQPLHSLGLPGRSIGTGRIRTDPGNKNSIRIDLAGAVVPRETIDWVKSDPQAVVYQPREVICSDFRLESDIYSIGMLLYLCLGGNPPFGTAFGEKLVNQIVFDEKVIEKLSLDEGAAELREIIHWSLSRSPEERNYDLKEIAMAARRLKDKMSPYAIVNRYRRKGKYQEALQKLDEFLEQKLPPEQEIQLLELKYDIMTVILDIDSPKRAESGKEAEKALKRAISIAKTYRLNLQTAQLKNKLATFYMKIRFFKMARKEIEAAAIISKNDFTITLNFADILLQLGEIDNGIRVLEKMKEAYPHHPQVAESLIKAYYYEKRDLEYSEQLCRHTFELMKPAKPLLILYSHIIIDRGKCDEAIRLLKELDPSKTDVKIQNLLAEAYMKSDDLEQAIEHLLASLGLKGGQDKVIEQLVQLLDDNNINLVLE